MSDPPHSLTIRVYYEDTDFSGAVYHANYLRFFERGRTELLRSFGISQSTAMMQGDATGFGFVVRRMTIDFHRPARMDDLLLVTTGIAKVGGASLSLDQSIVRNGELLVEAKVLVACVAGGRPRPLPPELRRQLSAAVP